MEPVLTNTCEYSEEHLTEALSVQIRELQKRKNILFYAAAGLLLAYSLYGWLIGKDRNYLFYALLCAACFGLLILTNRSLPRRTAKLQVARILQQNGSLSFQSQFREDGVAVLSPTGVENSLVPYERFSKLVSTAHLLLLFTDERKMILLDPTRFEGGTERDLMELLRQKCPKVLPLER